MTFVWSWWWGGPAVLVSPAFLAAALVIFLARPDRWQNRFLGLFFLSWGLYALTSGLVFLATEASTAYALAVVSSIAVVGFHVAYLLFLGTLATPITAWLRTRTARTLVVGAGVAVIAHMLAFTQRWQAGVEPGPGDVAWINLPGPAWIPLDVVSIAMLALAIVAAASTYKRATGTAARRQARAYLVGFVVFDGIFVLLVAALLASVPLTGAIAGGPWFSWGVLLAGLWLVAALGYGVLTTQLFDIELRIKAGLRRSTVLGIFLVALLVATEGAQVLFGEENPWVGIAAAALLVFALAPLQRFAERVADTAMPHVQDTDEYRTVRKREVYRAAVESALVDGQVTDQERDVLATLADHLGLSAGDARTIERQATGEVG